MKTGRIAAPLFVLMAAAICVVAFETWAVAQTNPTTITQKPVSTEPGQNLPVLKLEDLEQMALKNNPTLQQAEAAIRAAEGRRRQAGLWPNPIVGYEAEGLAFNPDTRANRSGHYVFVEQNILLGGKLGKSKNIAAQEKVQAQSGADAQRLRVVNAVRALYYEALGAQQMVELRRQLADLTREAVNISDELFNVGQSDRPDVLAAEVEQQRAELDLLRAQNDFNRVWQMLAAVVGNSQLKASGLEGNLEAEAPKLEQDKMLTILLGESPEMKQAMAGVERAKAVISRAKAEPMPDVFLRGSIGNNNEFEEFSGFRVGKEARVEAGVRIPIFNRNQGNVAAAKAELTSAEAEVRRVELALRARLAESFNRYLTLLGTASRYQREMLPRAQKAYELYLAKFRQMGAAYPQVLISQRTLFQLRAEYISSLVELWQNVTELRGMLLVGGLDAPAGVPGATTMGGSNQ
ncbi:MAG: TolC family protein [Acidobacteriota bacterium]